MNPFHANLTMLRVLDALADERTHTRVAERLGMTQSGVSHAMRAWTDQMGGPLIRRNGREIAFTPLGEAVLQEVRAALLHLHAIARLCGDRALVGHVRLGVVASAAIGIAPPALEALRRRHPTITVEMIEGTDDEVADWFARGLLDVAVAMSSPARSATRLTTVELVAVLHAAHPLRGYRSISPADLAGQPFVMSSSGCEADIARYAKAGGVSLDVTLRVRDTRALLAAVRASMGLTILPTLSVEGAGDGIATKALNPPLRRDLHMALSPDADDAARAVCEAIEVVC